MRVENIDRDPWDHLRTDTEGELFIMRDGNISKYLVNLGELPPWSHLQTDTNQSVWG